MKLTTQILLQIRMIGLFKLFHLTILILTLVLITTGCGGLSTKENQKYYDVEVEFTEFYINIPMSSTMVQKGILKMIAILMLHSRSTFLP